MGKSTRVMKLKVAELDRSVLPLEARTPGRAAFHDAVSQFLRKQFRQLGGVIEALTFGPDAIEVWWAPERGGPDPLIPVTAMLQRGELREGAVLLRLLLSATPDDPDLLYNLGLALSDLGQLDEAVTRLRRLSEVAPSHVNGRVALGVALARLGQDEPARAALAEAVALAPDNPWAQRNLGACLLRLGRPTEAVTHLQQATALAPEDARAWYGLGQAAEAAGDLGAADAAYKQALALDEFGEVARLAQEALTRLSGLTFRQRGSGLPRMDAVMYCVDALQRYAQMTPAQVQEIGFEIAMLGTQGLDVNDPMERYTLRSLPGRFSGLQLVALMYVAFRQIAPGQDVGFDLAREYEMARGMGEG